MLDLKKFIKNSEQFIHQLEKRKVKREDLLTILELAKSRSQVMTTLQNLESERNKISKEIGIKKAAGQDASNLFVQVSELKKRIEAIKQEETDINHNIKEKMLYIPNLPSDKTPDGEDENDNLVLSTNDQIGNKLIKDVKPHYEIGVDLDLIDFERAVKLSGSRFWAYKKDGAKMIRALENFMLDTHIKNGYEEWRPPVIVRSHILQGTGQLPKFEDDLFKIEGSDSYLIPTAEVPLTNLYHNEIIDLKKPIALTAFTPCFRAEAGSGGRDMKGLIRAHQFNKVELVKFVTKDQLAEEYKKTIEDAKNILNLLELPYREIQLCVGDLGFSAEQTLDLEVWIPSERRFREISSISSFGDFQGRRASIRYKDQDGKSTYAYTINGSGLAIDRTMAAILENCQNPDGTITIPKALRPYMNNQEIIKK